MTAVAEPTDSLWTNWQCPTCDREWKGTRPRSHLCPDGTLYVSPSTLASKQQCDMQAWLRGMGASLTEDNIAAFAGQCVHVALADYYRQGDSAQAEEVFREVYQPYADIHVDPNGALARLTYENTSKIFTEWLRRYKLDAEYVLWTQAAEPNPLVRVIPDMVEVAFQLTLSEEHKIVVIGILDALVEEYQTGQWLVKDHKSTGHLDKNWWAQWQLDAQPSAYVWAGREMSSKPVMGVIINGIQFGQLPSDPKRKCYLHKVPYVECAMSHAVMNMVQFDRTDRAIADWKKEAILASRELRQLLATYPALTDCEKPRVQGRFNKGCRYCFGSRFCNADRLIPVGEAFTVGEGMVADD